MRRGSDDIASCSYKTLRSLPDCISNVITYSNTCGGQNRNINMSAILSFLCNGRKITIDENFLIPGHTHFKRYADLSQTKRSKKCLNINMKVQMDSFCKNSKGQFVVNEMKQQSFFSFKTFMTTSLIKRSVDTEEDKIN